MRASAEQTASHRVPKTATKVGSAGASVQSASSQRRSSGSCKAASPPRPTDHETFPTALAALGYAHLLHADQRRDSDGAPFILHPLEVGGLLYRAHASDHVIAAGSLHDTIEKGSAAVADLEARFGSPVAALVLALTENERISGYAERKAALREQVARAGREPLTVLAADKISKARELRLETARTVSRPRCSHRYRSGRLTHYGHCLRLLQDRLPDSSLVARLGAELNMVLCAGRGRLEQDDVMDLGG